jgi:hypothetical protein
MKYMLLKYMLQDHQKDVAEFRKAARDRKDPDVKDFAATTLPNSRRAPEDGGEDFTEHQVRTRGRPLACAVVAI